MLEPHFETVAEQVASRVEDLLRGREPAIVAEYYAPREASVFLNLPVKTLEHWRITGVGPAYTRVGRHVRYHIDDLRAFMRKDRVEPAGGGGS